MKLRIFTSVALTAVFFLFFINCKGDAVPSNSTQVAPGELPKDLKPASVSLIDVNCWTEGDMFYAVGLMDSKEPFWRKYWLEIGVTDAAHQIVKFKTDSFCLVNTTADALPPNGRTAFFASWKLSELGGTPDSIMLRGARSAEMTPGPILIATNLGGGVKMLQKDSMNESSAREMFWIVNGTVENPLPLPLENPAMTMLVYGNDKRLWFMQDLNLNADSSFVRTSRYGPMTPNEKREFGMYIYYDNLPNGLRNARIGRIDYLGYEKRSQPKK